ncbi:hypothetical protein [Flavobacterium terrisoli]|uniref:hypothetical protein n=1 Tax=Flavobacterium terrisoli TaxID=3242195 RepID=UPI0025429D96|nr:hypothetical protein [Flavobacterium buctense]
MGTEIKNTLYRFVTMRAPELIEQTEINGSFVQHPEWDKESPFNSVFLDAVSSITIGQTRRDVLSETANTFKSTAIPNKDKLRAAVGGELYDYAMWLSKNRSSFDINEIKDKTTALSVTALDDFNDVEIDLWDNLFYQIVTFKSSYVRDALLSLFVAEFFIKHYDTSETEIKVIRDLAQARVILPKFLFGAEDNSMAVESKKVDPTKLPFNSKTLQKANELLRIEDNKKTYEAIRKSLLEVERKYNVVNQNDLNEYNAQHNDDVKTAYAAATEVVKTYTDPVTQREETYIVYEDLTLPEYNFEPKGQLAYCQDVSSKLNIHFNFIEYCVNELLYSTFKEAYDFIDDAISKLYSQQFGRTETSKRLANVNGVVVQTNSGESFARTVAGFTFMTLNSSYPNKYLALTFLDMEPGTDIVSGEYTITFEDSSTVEGVYVNQNASSEWVNGKLVLKIFNYAGNYFDPADEGTLSIVGTFTSSVGRVLTIDGSGDIAAANSTNLSLSDAIENDPNPTTYDPLTEILLAKGYGSYIYEDLVVGSSGTSNTNDYGAGITNPPEDEPSTVISSGQNVIRYIPSGYGIKRLGIADYRKVEQEICCYVPGEVSHIENVMAREYKEKSTRRLRRQEDTITTSKEKETEKLTDSTSTERFEMNQEVSSVLAEQYSLNLHAGVSTSVNLSGAGSMSTNYSGDFAYNTSQENSDHQAVTQATEVTERVLERVVQKVKEERITKIIEEFEENNKHGYDNRKGDRHISGVYRWVDKIYRNQVVNYGKRLMYEFMIPEPASFHNLATKIKIEGNEVELLEQPIDPRTFPGNLTLKDYTYINEDTYPHWAAIYNAEIEPMPASEIVIGKSMFIEQAPPQNESVSKSDNIKIQEGYYSYQAKATIGGHYDTSNQPHSITVLFGNRDYGTLTKVKGIFPSLSSSANSLTEDAIPYINVSNFRGEFPIAVQYYNYHTGIVNVSVKCKLSAEVELQWKMDTFNAIISAYEDKLAAYNDKMAELKSMEEIKVKTNPLFYRQIENLVLRKNCIEYMIGHTALGGTPLLEGDTFSTTHVRYDSLELETYANTVKFFEQAFEWNLMSYNFYPFYWAQKANWQKLYNETEADDPLFRSFLQSGMARVIVTVRPGFEEVVNWFMGTGQVWNGGQVPTFNDPLFISIVKELRDIKRVVEETWESRVPTSLTVIQAGSIGLNVEGLPCDDDCKDYSGFDSDDNPIVNPIQQNPDGTQLGNVVEDLETITDSIEEIKEDIEEIKNTLDEMNP